MQKIKKKDQIQTLTLQNEELTKQLSEVTKENVLANSRIDSIIPAAFIFGVVLFFFGIVLGIVMSNHV